MKYALLVLFSSWTLTLTTQAHPTGHETSFLETTQHLLTQPDHLIWSALALGMAASVYCLRLAFAKK